jgi:hypothetical protein
MELLLLGVNNCFFKTAASYIRRQENQNTHISRTPKKKENYLGSRSTPDFGIGNFIELRKELTSIVMREDNQVRK